MPRDGVAVDEAERGAQFVGLETGDVVRPHGSPRAPPRTGDAPSGVAQVEVRLEPVAGGDDDRTLERVMTVEDAGCSEFGVRRETLECFEPGVLVTRGETDEHAADSTRRRT